MNVIQDAWGTKVGYEMLGYGSTSIALNVVGNNL